MRVPLSWLAEFVDLPPVGELTHCLTQGGLEVEGVESGGPDLSAIRVGQVLSREAHPNADRLSLCTVDIGDGEPRAIVCGAPNVAAGQKVAVAVPGTRLPDGTKLKKSKIRGVASQGMICSRSELGLGEGHEGILVLEAGAAVGAPLSDLLDAGDTVLDLFLTPNRGDCASLLGVAREVRAHFDRGEVRLPPVEPETEEGEPASEAVTIAIDDRAGCHRYVGRVVRGVEIGPSPAWLQQRLEAAGLRPINVVVDVTNLVLFEFGQPLHAFDLRALRGGEVRVRAARADEKIVTLDGQTRVLEPADLVIADAERAIAVAGVMGGAESEVGSETVDVLIESAHFDPMRVRRTARRLGLSSEASYRFERGIDRAGVGRAADRAARLLAELAGGSVAPGSVEVEGDAPAVVESIDLDPERVNRLLGTELSPAEIATLLERVGVASGARGSGLQCRIPTHRNDLARPVDLIEEVARIHGYDRIPPTLPAERLAPVAHPPLRALAERVRDTLRAVGLTECMTLPLTGPGSLDRLGLAEDDPRRRAVRVQNPLVEDERELRTTLLPSLLSLVQLNLNRQAHQLRVFELGRVFRPSGAGELPEEPLHLAAALTGGEGALWESESAPLYFQIKGVAERLLAELGQGVRQRPGSDEPFLHPAASLTLLAGKQPIGALGELHPETAARFEIEASCAVLSLDLSALAARPPTPVRYREVSRQPAVRRDLAVLLPSDVAAEPVRRAIESSAGPHVVSVEIFDRYEGRGVPEGRVSLAFRLMFQRPDRTLTDEEVGKAVERVVAMLSERFQGELR